MGRCSDGPADAALAAACRCCADQWPQNMLSKGLQITSGAPGRRAGQSPSGVGPACGREPRLRCRSVGAGRTAAGLAGGGGCCSGGAGLRVLTAQAGLRVPTAHTTAFTAAVSAWVKANVHCPFVIIRRGAVVSGGRPTPYWPGTHLHVDCRAAGCCAFSAKACRGKEAHTLHVLGLVDCATLPPLPRCSAGERAHEDRQPVPAALQPRALA